jgi:hypothetical protein
MYRFLVSGVVLLLTLPAPCKTGYSESAVLSYARHLDVAQLDRTLPTQGLEDWLKTGSAHVDKLVWEISNCDLRGNSEEHSSKRILCVKFAFGRGAVGGWAILTVGTVLKGIDGPAHFEYAQIATAPPNARGRTTRRLSEIPLLLDEVAQPSRGR